MIRPRSSLTPLLRNIPIIAIAWMMLAVVAPAQQAAAPDQSCTLIRLVSLDMDTQTNGLFSIPVAINGHDVQMDVDTGSQVSSVSPTAVREFGLETKSVRYAGSFFNGIAINREATIDAFKLGFMSSKDPWHVLVLSEGMTAPSVSGLLGPDVMQSYDVDFDFFRGKFNLFAPHKCKGEAVYWTADAFAAMPMKLDENWHIVVTALLDGKKVEVMLDTGSDNSFMNLDAVRNLFGWDENDPRVKLLTSQRINNGDNAQIYTFPFALLDLDGVAIKNPNIQLIPRQNFDRYDQNNTQVVLGMNVLRQLHIYVAYQEQMLYLTAAEATAPAAPAPPPTAGAPAAPGGK